MTYRKSLSLHYLNSEITFHEYEHFNNSQVYLILGGYYADYYMDRIQIGDRIPEFSLKNQDGNIVDINEYLGKKKIVIYFYPKDGSLSCTRQACFFRDLSDVFEETGAVVIGISQQSVESHKRFADANNLNFNILSDPDNTVRKLFGVPSQLFGLIPGRVTYVADKAGKVVYIFDSQTDVQRHVDEALKICLVLKKTDKEE